MQTTLVAGALASALALAGGACESRSHLPVHVPRELQQQGTTTTFSIKDLRSRRISLVRAEPIELNSLTMRLLMAREAHLKFAQVRGRRRDGCGTASDRLETARRPNRPEGPASLPAQGATQ